MKHYVKLPKVVLLHGRQDFIVKRCNGKRVLHVGCVDAGLVEERFRRGELMHQRIGNVASELWGLDINREGITFLQQQGIKNLMCGDFSDLEPSVRERLGERPFDIIVAPEVVEHLLNPGLFLAAARSLMLPGKCELIVTVPNAFRLDTLIGLFRGVENVNPDHNYWFSYQTATCLMQKAGLSPDEVYVYAFESASVVKRWSQQGRKGDGSPHGGGLAKPGDQHGPAEEGRSLKHRILASLLYRYSPFWADGLILVSTLKDGKPRPQ